MTEEIEILKPKTSKTLLFITICLIFTIGGIYIAREEVLKGWIITSFFVLGWIIFIIQLIPGSAQLTLSEEGFVITSLFRSDLTRWSEVKRFDVGYLGRKEAVMFDYVDDHTKHQFGKSIAKNLSDYHGAIPGNYGLTPTDLADRMNYWKNKCGA